MLTEWRERLKNRLDHFDFDFVRAFKAWAIGSALVVIGSWAAFFLMEPNWGIDFTGGTEIRIAFDDPIEVSELRSVLSELGIPNDAVQSVGLPSEHAFKIRIKDPSFGAEGLEARVVQALQETMGRDWVANWEDDVRFSAEVGARFTIRYQGQRTLPAQVEQALAGRVSDVRVEEGREDNELVIKLPSLAAQIQEQFRGTISDREFQVLSVSSVGPRVGESLRQQAFLALGATLILILIYVAFRFEVTFAPGAVLALFHDVSATLGVFVVMGKELNLQFVAALLTILGYSINDTIVIYDRIRENRVRFARDDLKTLINVSINETLARTLATSFTTAIGILPFLFLGTEVIQDFTFAILLGVFFGSYSTICVASPMIIVTERWRPWLERLVAIDTGDEEDDVPEEFLSESEKRRRERQRSQAAADLPEDLLSSGRRRDDDEARPK